MGGVFAYLMRRTDYVYLCMQMIETVGEDSFETVTLYR